MDGLQELTNGLLDGRPTIPDPGPPTPTCFLRSEVRNPQPKLQSKSRENECTYMNNLHGRHIAFGGGVQRVQTQPGTAPIFLATLYINSKTGKATDMESWRRGSVGISRDCPIFCGTPIISVCTKISCCTLNGLKRLDLCNNQFEEDCIKAPTFNQLCVNQTKSTTANNGDHNTYCAAI